MIVAMDEADRSTTPLIEGHAMLFTIAIILLILWALGAFIIPFGGGLIHILLVIALIVIVYRLLTGQKVA
jgi:hypothetical protein